MNKKTSTVKTLVGADKKMVGKDDGPSADSFSLASIGTYMFFQEVNEDTAKDYCEFIIKSNYIFPTDHPLTVMINSPGGGVYDGFGMIDLMECSRLKIATVAVGIVASMAALLFTAGTKGMRTMSRNSFIMTHQFSNWTEGKYHEFVAQRPHEDELHKRLVGHFVRHTKMTPKLIDEVILGKSDHYIDAKQALKYGMCDRIADPWS